jgi:small subunit ribosomal protein S20
MLTEKEKSQVKQSRNRRYKTLIKNQFKKVEKCLKEKGTSAEEMKSLVAETQKILDKASNKKVIHKNKAARKKSRLHKLIFPTNKISISE